LAGSILGVLPAALFFTREDLLAITGGIAAAIAVGAFAGQALAILFALSEPQRRRRTALGGLFGLGVMIGLILLSAKAS
jgi:uncharacterized membrane protein YciS (DUF1049 family)